MLILGSISHTKTLHPEVKGRTILHVVRFHINNVHGKNLIEKTTWSDIKASFGKEVLLTKYLMAFYNA